MPAAPSSGIIEAIIYAAWPAARHGDALSKSGAWTPAIRTLTPFEHHRGPSPSCTRVTMHENVAVGARSIIRASFARNRHSIQPVGQRFPISKLRSIPRRRSLHRRSYKLASGLSETDTSRWSQTNNYVGTHNEASARSAA